MCRMRLPVCMAMSLSFFKPNAGVFVGVTPNAPSTTFLFELEGHVARDAAALLAKLSASANYDDIKRRGCRLGIRAGMDFDL